ncbi:MAG TPA: ABC transporter ATP-binding protein [Steroidobacteraceae bacterium]|jgi:putative ABC transport system ATP-binding protein|nr:ABC transporter ATP-binding protein [Steroidobacteraceae bacterium]
MISLASVSKRYRTTDLETTALNDVNIEIEKGEFVAVMGPSGCGKSTLLNIVGLIDSPTSGHYLLDGEDVARYGEDQLTDVRMHSVGFIFQNFNLIDDLTVEENVELPLIYQNMARAARRSRVREVLELVDLKPRARHKPTQLSGGQQQRVAVARAVVSDPKLIVADEPTGNLDTRNGEDVMDMLATLNQQGATIVMVTHSPSHAGRAHRLINLLDGRVVPNVGDVI